MAAPAVISEVTPEKRDARDLIGMRTPAASLVVATYLVGLAAAAFWSGTGPRYYATAAAAFMLAAVAALVLIFAPHDPLPRLSTVFVAAAGPAGTALILCVAPVPIAHPLQTWPIGAGAAAGSFLCVRGRTPSAWAGSVSTVAVAVIWSTSTHQGLGPGLGLSLTSMGPLLMASFFSYVIRPAAAEIFALRAEATARISAQAASEAVLDERRIRSQHLSKLVRPVLQRIAAGPPLDRHEAETVRLLEADLRDHIRAARLAVPVVTNAARAARTRGVTVVLLDDYGPGDLPNGVLAPFYDLAVDELDKADEGSVTIRLHPSGREHLASILVRKTPETAYRIDL